MFEKGGGCTHAFSKSHFGDYFLYCSSLVTRGIIKTLVCLFFAICSQEPLYGVFIVEEIRAMTIPGASVPVLMSMSVLLSIGLTYVCLSQSARK